MASKKSKGPAANLEVVEDFCSRLELLPHTPKAPQHYGAIRAALERRRALRGLWLGCQFHALGHHVAHQTRGLQV
jgi:predicted nucleic acid-binding protein